MSLSWSGQGASAHLSAASMHLAAKAKECGLPSVEFWLQLPRPPILHLFWQLRLMRAAIPSLPSKSQRTWFSGLEKHIRSYLDVMYTQVFLFFNTDDKAFL
jgi:hypothetical protein